MTAQAAGALDIEIHVLDPAEHPPAAAPAARHVRGALDDPGAIATLASGCDLISYEIETGDPGVLRRVGTPVEPAPAALEIIQDKLVQRRFLAEAGVPGPRFFAFGDVGLNATARSSGEAETSLDLPFPLPFVQKARRGGYDGRGVAIVNAFEEEPGDRHGNRDRPTADHAGRNYRFPETGIPWNDGCYIEEAVPIAKEIAVIVARSTTGEIATYDPVEMHVDPELNLVDAVIAPAELDPRLHRDARSIAEAAVAALPGAGIFAVELFVTSDGAILVNEIAPRPHNSGHLTIEAAETSQYEQFLRAITGLPLGSTAFHRPAVMRNLLGGPTAGRTEYRGIDLALTIPGVHLHLYGKRESRPGRKMGHVTAVGPEAWARAAEAWRHITIDGI